MEHWLSKLRRDAGFNTVRSLADVSGIDNSTLSRIEKDGGPQPTPATLKKLAPYLKVSYTELMFLSGHLNRDDFAMSNAVIESPMGNSFMDEDFLKDLSVAKGKSIDEMNLEMRRMLRYQNIDFSGMDEGGQWDKINRIKEVMLSNKNSLEENVAQEDFLNALDNIKSLRNMPQHEHLNLLLRMKLATKVFPALFEHIKDDSELSTFLSDDIEAKSTTYRLPNNMTVRIQDHTVAIPIIGTVRAGQNGLAFEDPLGYHRISADSVSSDYPSYFLQVRGDSMSPYLLPGDLVLFHEDADVPSGSLAIVIVDGEEGTVKWLKRGEGFVKLEAENPYYPARDFAGKDLLDIRIVGAVTEIIRKPTKKNGILSK